MKDREAIDREIDARIEATSLDVGLHWMVTSVAAGFEARLAQLRSVVERYQSEDVEPQALRQARSKVPRQRRRIVESAVDGFEAGLQLVAAEADVLAEEEPGTSDLAPQPELAAVGALLLIGESRLNELTSALLVAAHDASGVAYARALLDWRQAHHRPPAYLDACLPAAVSEFEELLAALLRVGQMINPKALNAHNRTATLEQYEARGGLDGARLFAFNEASRSLINDGPVKWRERLGRWPGIDLAELVDDWDSSVEIFLRRNVIIHTGGRADFHYLDRLPKNDDRPQLGELLACEPEYLLGALDRLASLGQALAILWLRKLRPAATAQHEQANALVVSMLTKRRWGLAERLAGAFLAHEVGTPGQMQVNRWMAQREGAGSKEAIEGAVNSWEPPDSGVSWLIAKAALLGDASAVIRELTEAVRIGESITDYASWPLLVLLRKTEPALGVLLDQARFAEAKRSRQRGR